MGKLPDRPLYNRGLIAIPGGPHHDEPFPPCPGRLRSDACVRRQRPGAAHRHGRRRHLDGPALRKPLSQQQHRRACLREADHARCRFAAHPGARRDVEGDQPDHLGVQAAEGREVSRRVGLHRRGRRVLDRPGRQDSRFAGAVHDLHQGDHRRSTSSTRRRSGSSPPRRIRSSRTTSTRSTSCPRRRRPGRQRRTSTPARR